MRTIFRKSKFRFFSFSALSIFLWITSGYTKYHFYYLHYYFSVVSVLYLFSVSVRYIIVETSQFKLISGIIKKTCFLVEWKDVVHIALTTFPTSRHGLAGGLTAFSINEKVEIVCLRFKLSDSFSLKNTKPIQNNEFVWNPLNRELSIINEPSGGFVKLIETIEKHRAVEITHTINRLERLIERIMAFVGLFLFVLLFIGLIAWIFH